MNLLFFQRNLDPSFGGIERVTWVLSNFFRQKGIVCYHAFFESDDCPQLPEEYKFHFDEKGGEEDLSRILDFIVTKQIDIIINQDINGCFNLVNLKTKLKRKGLKTKIIGVAHLCPDYEKYKHYPLKTRLKQLAILIFKGYYKPEKQRAIMAKSVDRYVLLSPSYILPIRIMFALWKKSKVLAIPNPIPFSQSSFPDWDTKRNNFLIVARMDEQQKNFSSALRIWKAFESKDNRYTLLIAGGGGCEEKVKEYAKNLSVERVKFLGHVNDPRDLYRESKFYIMTSRYEGLPMTILEAMQFGCVPIVMNSFSSINDIVNDKHTGLLVASGDEEAFCSVMLNIIRDDSLQRRISQAAYDSIKRFDVDTVGNMWLKLFNELLTKE